MDKIAFFLGRKIHVYCDGKCNKAFGINSRPKALNMYLSDDEVGEVPKDCQPAPEEKLTDWCLTNCERCFMLGNGPLSVPNFNNRFQINS